MKKIIIILFIFFLDRISKFYLLSLEASGIEVDFYVFSFLNLYLVWNTGIAFGLVSLEANNYYHILTGLILIINLVLIYFLFKERGIYGYLLALIIGGSLGNLIDRIYYLI